MRLALRLPIEILSKLIGLLGSVPAAPFVPSNLFRNGGLAPAKIRGNLGAIQSFFHEAKNLIPFVLAEMVIFHGNLTVQVKKLWILIHSQPLNF